MQVLLHVEIGHRQQEILACLARPRGGEDRIDAVGDDHDAPTHAPRKRVAGALVKVAPPEHLLLEALRVYRRETLDLEFRAAADPEPRCALRAARRGKSRQGTRSRKIGL